MSSARAALACAIAGLAVSVLACSRAASGPDAPLPQAAGIHEGDDPSADASEEPTGGEADGGEKVAAPDLLNPSPAGGGADAVPSDATPDEGATLPIRAKLTLEPSSVMSQAEAKELRLRIRLENVGADAIEAPWKRTSLLLDGKPLSEWKDLRETLPLKTMAPKQAVEMSYQPSDKAVIKPGSYEFVLEVAGGRSEPAVLTVEP